jgi:hypothetical protein
MHILRTLKRIPFFRIWYSSTYTVLFFILIIFLAITPGDTIYQSFRSNELEKLFSIGGVYVLTFLVTLLVYSTRLYTNRTVLQAIPKPYIPIEDGEVGKIVRRMIVKALKRSAIVAWDSRPRDVRGEAREEEHGGSQPPTTERNSFVSKRRSHLIKEATVIPVLASSPPWGRVSHPGWGAPDSEDMANLQYWQIVTELPNLIEAKAVSLAPPDPAVDGSQHLQNGMPMLPDAQVVALLQRPRAMGVRDYLGRLASYGLINPPSLGPKFLSQYEHARFSTQALTETQFRDLMSVFAEILNGMSELDPEVVEEARMADIDSDTRSLMPSETSSSSTQAMRIYRTPRLESNTDYFDTRASLDLRDGSESPQTLRTAQSMQRGPSSGMHTLPRTPSERSFGSGSVIRHVQSSPSTIHPNSSSSSVRSGGSVIRLHPSPGPGDLPYEYLLEDEEHNDFAQSRPSYSTG